jgi:hypothetical protein
MREQKKVTINENTYMLEQFGARKGIKLGKQVAKVMLPVLGRLYGQDENEEVGFGGMLEVVADNLDELDESTIEALLEGVSCNSYAIDFDKQFSGNYGELFQLLWEVISFNFSDVFSIVPGDTDQ